MKTASQRLAAAGQRTRACVFACVLLAYGAQANAAGTAVGTVIENTASVSFDLGGTRTTIVTNTTTLTVAERVDVVVTLASPQLLVAAGDANRALLFTVTNTGNGSETFSLGSDNAIGGDDFDPIAAVPAIYFDSDASGDLTAADVAYTPGVNDPVLAADESVDVFLVNDIPAAVANGDIGRSRLTASSLTGTGTPGTVVVGAGDAGTDAVIGTTGGEASAEGEYVVSDIAVNVVKTQLVQDPFGGSEPVPGATITYTVTLEVVGSGTATASVFRDPIPTYTTFLPGSITLNGASLTDAADADAGELDTATAATIVVRLGDLTLADGTQTVEFQATID
ncbi:MAG: hypothetical protein QNJ00_09490 [Woeseiaceae bacterium]|nr:hypothetical protein [Woeseiaceae bacterium]